MCERGEVLHLGSSQFIEFIAGEGAPPSTATSRCPKAEASRTWAGFGRTLVRSHEWWALLYPAFWPLAPTALPNVSLVTIKPGSKLCSRFLFSTYLFKIFFGFQKLYKNKIWKWENLYYQKIIFIRFLEKLYF